ncbi:uncharacterized protein LOC119590586 [Penaeus monodon]|uniref:uncharacterized protein LOC119590586 n=1 Tax=Penaeus monodon TaxID=6687 RepID=UPI0018A77DD5|nr:uncharacterized protein LOC119590586 [Penaeus monodon]
MPKAKRRLQQLRESAERARKAFQDKKKGKEKAIETYGEDIEEVASGTTREHSRSPTPTPSTSLTPPPPRAFTSAEKRKSFITKHGKNVENIINIIIRKDRLEELTCNLST